MLYANGQPLTLGPELGRGGQGAVYEVAGAPSEVAKLYLVPPSAAQIRKLEALTALTDEGLLAVSAWPLRTVTDERGQAQGFTMPRISGEYHELHSLYTPSSRAELFPEADWGFLVHVARNVARAFATLHAHGVVLGDVSSRNVLVSPRGVVRLIDTDSFQVAGLPCPVGTAEFTPPELQGRSFGDLIRTPHHDQFGLATLVFHLLFQGRHPYAGVHAASEVLSPAEAIAAHAFAYARRPRGDVKPPPRTLRLTDLPETVADLFEAAFAPSGARPSAAAWESALAALASGLTRCKSGHVHPAGGACPWCRLQPLARMGKGAFRLQGRIDAEAVLRQLEDRVRAVPPPPIGIQPQLVVAAPRTKPLLNLAPLPPPTTRERLWLWLGRALLLLTFALAMLLIARLGGAAQSLAALVALIFALNADARTWLEGHGPAFFHELSQTWVLTLNSARTQQKRAYLKRLSELAQAREDAQRELAAASRQLTRGADTRKLDRARGAVDRAYKNARDVMQRGADENVVGQYRDQALRAYLARQVITAALVRGLTAEGLQQLHRAGIRTASDITSAALKPLPLSGTQKNELLRYRHALEDFYAFDVSSVPPRALAKAYKQHSAALRSAFAALERATERLEQLGAAYAGTAQAERRVAQLKRELLDIAEEMQALEDVLGLGITH